MTPSIVRPRPPNIGSAAKVLRVRSASSFFVLVVMTFLARWKSINRSRSGSVPSGGNGNLALRQEPTACSGQRSARR